MQQFGETADAICEDDMRLIDKALEVNKDLRDPYWILIFAKPGKTLTPDGRYTIMRHFKAHLTKPPSMVGAIRIEVDNVKGTLEWEINMPDKPFNIGALGGKESDTTLFKTSIPKNLYTHV